MSDSPPSTQTEVQRKEGLLSDIASARAKIEDSIHMGNSMFGRFAHADVAREVTIRKEDLQKKKEALEEDIRQKESIIQRTNRDFTDVKDTLPETEEQKRIRFIEDYTLMFLTLSYVFMVLSAIVYTVVLSSTPWPTFFNALGVSALGTALAGILLYIIA
jgi:hypothetical protein